MLIDQCLKLLRILPPVCPVQRAHFQGAPGSAVVPADQLHQNCSWLSYWQMFWSIFSLFFLPTASERYSGIHNNHSASLIRC